MRSMTSMIRPHLLNNREQLPREPYEGFFRKSRPVNYGVTGIPVPPNVV